MKLDNSHLGTVSKPSLRFSLVRNPLTNRILKREGGYEEAGQLDIHVS